jgi:hypothetical protein
MTETLQTLLDEARVFVRDCRALGDETDPVPKLCRMIDRLCAALSAPAPAANHVAVVEEQLEDFKAVVRWMFNPVPEGAYLSWQEQPGLAAPSAQPETKAGECSDCPPLEYPTDETRCAPCPNRAPASPAPTREGACCVDLGKEECGYPDCPGPKRTPLPDIAALRERAEIAIRSTDGWRVERTDGQTGFVMSDLIRDLAAALPSAGTGEKEEKARLRAALERYLSAHDAGWHINMIGLKAMAENARAALSSLTPEGKR